MIRVVMFNQDLISLYIVTLLFDIGLIVYCITQMKHRSVWHRSFCAILVIASFALGFLAFLNPWYIQV